jgi:hypothetical protein
VSKATNSTKSSVLYKPQGRCLRQMSEQPRCRNAQWV